MDATEEAERRGDVGKLGPKERFEMLLRAVRRETVLSDQASGEYDGIRSEVDFRRAMAIEEERRRGSWVSRSLRALNVMAAALRNSRAMRLLR
jgi:hypothetical protein